MLNKLETLQNLKNMSGLDTSIQKSKVIWTQQCHKIKLTIQDVTTMKLPVQCETCILTFPTQRSKNHHK